MRANWNKSSALRNLAEVEELIDWCERTQRGGLMFSPQKLLAIHEHVPVDYTDLQAKLECERDKHKADVLKYLATPIHTQQTDGKK